MNKSKNLINKYSNKSINKIFNKLCNSNNFQMIISLIQKIKMMTAGELGNE